jgi:hypothetical protein
MRIHTICAEHGTTALVGPGSLLNEYECVVCVAISDQAYAESRRPCCSRANVDCCGHDDDDYEPYPLLASIDSPNFCGGLSDPRHRTDEVPF